ncbi:MAG: hypothetical protein SFT81_05325 [Candidatus Caenarcaniphilales bacterium]|nr:hypothetical protein [Candidatus Caenarcaniphilales bacterium]
MFSMRKIFQDRFQAARIEYFSTHTFRHLACKLAFARCRNGFDIKAVSQNFCHEHVGTTMITYGSLYNSQVCELIAGLDFSNTKEGDEDLASAIEKLIRDRKKGNF